MKRVLTFSVAVAFLLSACSSASMAGEAQPPAGLQQDVVQAQPTQVPTNPGPTFPLVAPNPAAGASVYAEKCEPCHGSAGQGDGPQALQLPNPVTAIGLEEVARQSSPLEWFNVVTRGNMSRFMPPFPSLSDRQRWDVIAYVYSLSSKPDTLAQGQELYADNCAACHGESGRGDGPQASSISRPLPDLTDQAYMVQKSASDFFDIISTGISPEMPAFGDTLTEAERWAVAGYMRSFAFASSGPLAAAPTSNAASTPAGSGAEDQPLVSEGVLPGLVVNGSGGEPLGGVDVLLHGFDGMEVVFTSTTTTQADGTFIFENVEMPENRVFLATVERDGATYASPITTIRSGEEPLSLSITVFETTTDRSALIADRLHIFLDFTNPGIVQVVELYIMSNLGTKSIMPAQEGGTVAEFYLPESATNLQFQDGELGDRYVTIPGGFGDTIVLRPTVGEYQVLFAYDMPYESKLDIQHSLAMPVNALVILHPENGVKMKGESLQETGAREIQGEKFLMYTGGPLPTGSNLVMSLSGKPGNGAALVSVGTSDNLVIGLGAFGLAMIMAGVLLYRRNQNTEEEMDDEAGLDESPAVEEDPENLMDAIIALDDLYKAGELPEDAYRQRRAELKAQLQDVTEKG